MVSIVRIVPNAMVRETALPNLHSGPGCLGETVREAAFDKLHGAFQRDGRPRSQKHVDVIGHHDEFVKSENPPVPVPEERFEKKGSGPIGTKDRPAFPSYGCYKECPIEEIVHTQRLKPRSFRVVLVRLIAARFHGCAIVSSEDGANESVAPVDCRLKVPKMNVIAGKFVLRFSQNGRQRLAARLHRAHGDPARRHCAKGQAYLYWRDRLRMRRRGRARLPAVP